MNETQGLVAVPYRKYMGIGRQIPKSSIIWAFAQLPQFADKKESWGAQPFQHHHRENLEGN